MPEPTSPIRKDFNTRQSKTFNPPFESHVSANFLCNFMRMPGFQKTALRDMSLKPRYFEEDISYLQISGYTKLIFPVLCFCDIPLSKAIWHMNGGTMADGHMISGYGQYGIALKKDSCQGRDVQPVTYLNPNSILTKDLSDAIQKVIQLNAENGISDLLEFLPDTIQRFLMYSKPIQGYMQRGDEDPEERLFKDECEWRYIPRIPDSANLPLFLDSDCDKYTRDKYSDALNNQYKKLNFTFTVDDVVYLIVPNEKSAIDLSYYISRLRSKSTEDRRRLISKIEVAETFSKNLA